MIKSVILYFKEMNVISKRITYIIILLFTAMYCTAFLFYCGAGIVSDYYRCTEIVYIISENAKGILVAGLLPAILFEPIYKYYEE